MQTRELYRLLVDDSTAIRHAAAELVAGMLEPQGRHFLAQVGSVCSYLICRGMPATYVPLPRKLNM